MTESDETIPPDSFVEALTPDGDPDRPQAGVPDSTVTDTAPALGTSEEFAPVKGVHAPDAGPDGEQIDTDDPA